jgi:hypothetical protein
MKKPSKWPLWAFVAIALLAVFVLTNCADSSSPEPPETPVPVAADTVFVEVDVLQPPVITKIIAIENEVVGAWTVELPLPLYCFPRD